MDPRMDFGDAIRVLKAGGRVARQGWNGKGMWLVLIRAGTHGTQYGSFEMLDCIGMKTAQGQMLPGWLASQTDILSEDWVTVSE